MITKEERAFLGYPDRVQLEQCVKFEKHIGWVED